MRRNEQSRQSQKATYLWKEKAKLINEWENEVIDIDVKPLFHFVHSLYKQVHVRHSDLLSELIIPTMHIDIPHTHSTMSVCMYILC